MIREYPKTDERKNLEVFLREDEKMIVYFMVFTLALVGIISISIAIAVKK